MNDSIFKAKWEDLEIYKKLPKSEIKTAYQNFIKIIACNLKTHGFVKRGRKLYRVSNDLVEIIDIDTRGSWLGLSNHFKIKICLMPLCWPDLSKEYYTVGGVDIEKIIPNIKNHYRITCEYELLADYFTRKIVKHVLPYFKHFNSTEKVVRRIEFFNPKKILDLGLQADSNKLSYLILFSEIKNHRNVYANEILIQIINQFEYWKKFPDSNSGFNFKFYEMYKELCELLKTEQWVEIDNWLLAIENIELKKLKFKRYSKVNIKNF